MGRRSRHRGGGEASAELILDPGVLSESPVIEAFGWRGARRIGGVAVLPWRADWLAATGSGTTAIPASTEIEGRCFGQGVVHLQKGRAATWWGLDQVWRLLEPGGRLLVCGGNALGIKAAVRRLAAELGQQETVVAARAHGRVAVFSKEGGGRPTPPESPTIEVDAAGDRFPLDTGAGVFSADEVDPGTRLLLGLLPSLGEPETVFDPGCGAGVLGLASVRRWRGARAVLADADWRAVECARANSERLGLGRRCELRWWTAATEDPPLASCDLVLSNPPIHTGKAVDLEPARAIFRAIDRTLAPGGSALIVALRTLPFERDLREIGRLRQVTEAGGYKVLEIRR